MRINVSQIIYYAILIGIVYIIYRLVNTTRKSSAASKIRKTMPDKSELRESRVNRSYLFAISVVNEFLASVKASAQCGANSTELRGYCPDGIITSIVTRTVRSELKKEGFLFVNVVFDDFKYHIDGRW